MKFFSRKPKAPRTPIESLETRLVMSAGTLGAIMPASADPIVAAVDNAIEVDNWPDALGATTLSGTTSVPIASYSAIYNCRLETRISGSNIGYVSTSGAYVEYEVDAPSAGSYSIALGLAAAKNASLDIAVNGSKAASVAVPATGSWDAYRTSNATINLAAGRNTIRITATGGTQYNLNAVTLAAAAPAPAPVTNTITVGSGTTIVPLASYTSIYNSRLETRSSGTNIGYVSTSGSHVEYALNVTASGNYRLDLGLANIANASMDVYANGSKLTSITIPASGNWDVYRTLGANLTLPAGNVALRLVSTNGTQYNLKSISLTKTTTATTPEVTNVTSGGTVPIDSYTAISGARLEVRSSGMNIGYVSTAGSYIDYAVTTSTAGTYDLGLGLAAANNASLDVYVNGSKAASYSIASTGNWDTYKTLTQKVTLAAGNNAIRITSTNGTQYNLNAVKFTPSTIAPPASDTPTTPTTPTTGPGATITQKWMTSFTELNITGSSGSDVITVSQSGNTLTINANGNVQTVTGTFGDVAIRTGGGNDSITVDSSVTLSVRLYGGSGADTLKNFTRGKATIVAIGGGKDYVQGNGINTSYWTSGDDTIVSSSSEQAAGRVHIVTGFYNGVSTELLGQNLTDPTATGSVTRLTNSSFWGTGPRMADVVQGQTPDCYLMSPLQGLAHDQPDRLMEIAVDLGDGTYAVRFLRYGVTTYVRVDGDLPAGGPYANGLWAAHPGSSGNQWTPIIEKAYAFFRTGSGTYSSLNYGWMSSVFNDLGIANTPLTPGTMTADAAYTAIKSALDANKVIAYGTRSTVYNGAALVGAHAYTIINAYKDSAGNPMFQLRNPWGFDAAGNDGNASDGIVTLNFTQLASNSSGTVVTV